MTPRQYRLLRGLTALVLLTALVVAVSASTAAAYVPPPPADGASSPAAGAATNLLANPNFDEAGYYFRRPNSLVPPKWFRWYVTPGAVIPEFIDGGSAYHNACYPSPPPGGLCENMTPKNRSLGYIKYGGPYIAGAWQPVSGVTACQDYQFSGYVRTDSQGYRSKVGIDPTGWRMPPKANPDPAYDYNCPPDGASLCPKETFSYESDMPTSTIWSAPYAEPSAPPMWQGPVAVTAEAVSTTITVWTYAAPINEGSQSTYWDMMSLIEIPKRTLAVSGTVPAPDGTIGTPVVTVGSTSAQVHWTVTPGALTQVLYGQRPGAPPDTSQLTRTLYLPMVATGAGCSRDFAQCTPVLQAASSSASATLTNLTPGATYDYVVMSRKVSGSSCVSSASVTGTFTTTATLR